MLLQPQAVHVPSEWRSPLRQPVAWPGYLSKMQVATGNTNPGIRRSAPGADGAEAGTGGAGVVGKRSYVVGCRRARWRLQFLQPAGYGGG